jgi:hypothetical protein
MLDLDLLPDEYAICRLPAGSPLPAGLGGADGTSLVSVTWTSDEVSVICRADLAPATATVERPWRCLRVVGPLDLALTGILASLVAPLAAGRVNVFALSTFDTDHLLIPAVRLDEALAVLSAAGHRFTGVALGAAAPGATGRATLPHHRPLTQPPASPAPDAGSSFSSPTQASASARPTRALRPA